MKKQNILLAMLALAFTFALPTVVSAQKTKAEKTQIKQNRNKLFEAHKAEIEAIENDATLSESEKEALITKKSTEFRQAVGKRAKGGKRGKGKFESKEAREEWKKQRQAISKEIEAIENDPNLTEEERETKKRALLNEKLGEKRRKGKKAGAYKKMDQRKAKREEIKAELDAIKNDPNLTEEQKAAKKQDLIGKNKKEGVIKGRKGDMKRGMHKEMTKKEWKEKYGKAGGEIAKKEMTTAQKERALSALKRNEDRLAKDLKKGKISQERYDERMARITQVREKLMKR